LWSFAFTPLHPPPPFQSMNDYLIQFFARVASRDQCSWGPVWKASEWSSMIDFVRTFSYKDEPPWLPVEGQFDDPNMWIREGRDLQSVWVLRYLLEAKKRTLVYTVDCANEVSVINV